MNRYYNFIHDQSELTRFLQILPQLERDDVWMLILCTRSKYLSGEERKRYSLKDSDVVERKIVRESGISRIMRVIKRFNTEIGSYTDAEENPLPEDCFVLYFSINPKSVAAGVKHLFERYLNYFLNLSQTDQMEDMWHRIKLLDSHVMTEVQSHNSHNKYFIDLDFDVVDKLKGKKYVHEYIDTYLKDQVEYYLIETHGGYHVLIKKESMSDFAKRNFYMAAKECEAAGRKVLGDKFEVIVNKQDMVPLPGSVQGGFVVRFMPGE